MLRVYKDSSPGDDSLGSSSLFGSYTPPTTPTSLEEEFDIVKILAEGCFAQILLAKRTLPNEKMVLKAIHCEVTTEEDFLRELQTNFFLSPHPNIVTSYNVSFVWNNCFVYVQEWAPFGDLSRFVKRGGLPEASVKLVAGQLTQALDFMHNSGLVHRDLKLENILVFKSNLSHIKLCDFGSTRGDGTLVRKTVQTWIPFSPPEICTVVCQENYYASKVADVWQAGIVLFVCLRGNVPWQVADITDPVYCQYTEWLRKKSFRLPEPFRFFTPRLIRLFKRILEPKPTRRYEITEISKYLGDDWIKRSTSTGPTTSLGAGEGLERKDSVRTTQSSNKSKSMNNQCNYASWRKRSSRRLQRNYEVDTELDKTLISQRVTNWIHSNSIKVSNSHEP